VLDSAPLPHKVAQTVVITSEPERLAPHVRLIDELAEEGQEEVQ
jgi:hypothetical protein